MAVGSIRLGDIFRVRNCPPLDGHAWSDRPVVILTPQPELDSGQDPVLAIGITTSVPDDHDAVPLPNEEDCHHPTMTGLTERSWALPRWMVQVLREALTDHVGRAHLVAVEQLVEAVSDRIDAGDYPILHDPTGL